MKDVCGIYFIKNTKNNKIYVGQSINIFKEWFSAHRPALRYNRHHNPHLQRAWNKYGEGCFEHGLVEECPKNKLDIFEKQYIRELNAHQSLGGYNIAWGGSGVMKNRKHTEITISKMKLSKSKISDLSKNRMSLSKIGTKKATSSSKYYGVSKRVANKNLNIYWRAGMFYKKKFVNIGNFKDEIDAAKAYDKYVLDNALNYPINFP